VTITNTGNSSDTFSLTGTSTGGSTVAIYSSGTTATSSTGSLAAGASYKCTVSVKMTGSATSDTITFTAKSQADSTKTAVGTYTVQKPAPASTSDACIVNWLLNGYYPNSNNTTNLSTDYLSGEASVSPLAGTVTAGKPWNAYTSKTDYVDLATYYVDPTYCAGYAFAYVYSPTAQKANMWMGSDDGIKVWINGTVAWTDDVHRPWVEDQDKTTVSLNAGWNKVLAKISQFSKTWGFSLKLCDSSGKAVSGLVYALAPTSIGDVTPPTIANVVVTPSADSAKITWTTNELSNTLVDYGTGTTQGTDYTDETMTTSHTATVTGLAPDTTYYATVGSQDAAGNTGWGSQVQFKTTGQTGAYVLDWLLNGYYTNTTTTTRMTTDYLGGEASVNPTAGSTSGGKTWVAYTSLTSYIDLMANYGAVSYAAAYGFVDVYSPTAQTVNMWMGSDDGIKVWVNGNVAWDNDVRRPYVADQDKTTVALNAGWNRVLAKSTQSTKTWGFSVKFCDSNGNAVPGLAYSPGL
jgi:hypothetical protein